MWTPVILMLLVSDIGYGLPTQGREVPDLYSVHQDRTGNSVLMMNPRRERPTLRDITYYHVVETAYPHPDSGHAAEVETERAFTNAHGQGYEFIDILPIDLAEDDAINDDDTDKSDKADAPTDDEITYYDEEETIQDENKNKTDIQVEENSPDKSSTDVDTANDDDDTEIYDEVKDDEAQETLDDAGSKTEASTVTNGTVAVNDDVATEEITTEKNPTTTVNIHRHQQQLFSSPEKLKERYLKMKNFIPSVKEQAVTKERRKRSVLDTTELKEIPEAPMLGEINYDSLPKYIRAMISTEKPNTKQPVTEVIEKMKYSYETEHEKHMNSIKNKMEHIFSNLKTKEVEFEDVIKALALDNQEDRVVNVKPDQVRTYGMNMSDDHGKVWNHLWSKPGMYYNVGDQTVEEPINMEEIPEAPMLGEINYDSLPKYIRAMISTEKPNTEQPVTEVIEKKKHSHETEHEKHRNSIKNKTEHIFSNLKTKEVEFEDVIKGLALDKQEDGVVNMKTDQVRTYGINTSDDHGKVWNHLWSKPGMYYNVGEQTVKEPINMEENKEVSNPEKPPYVNKPTAFKPDTEIQLGHKNPTEIENTKPEIDDDKVKDKPIALSTGSSLNQADDDESIKNADAAQQIPVDLKPLANEKDERIPESLSKLIEDDQFWDWLSNWTAAYAEMVIEHVGNAVKEEIEKQMSNKTMPIIQDLYPAVASTEKPDEKLESSETGIKEDNKNITNITIDELETEEDVKESEGRRKIIFTDEGEVVLELTLDDDEDEQEDLLRRRKNKDKNEIIDDKKPDASTEISVNKKGEKISANNIYGNAVGNEKVTNIFIFAPSNDTEVLLKLHLLTDDNGDLNTNSVVIDNRFSDIHDKEDATQIETEADIKNSTISGNKSDDLKPNKEKEKNNDADLLSQTEVSDKGQEQPDVNDTSDNTELTDDHEKEIEELKLTHMKEIDKLVTEHKKEIEKLESEHKKEMEKAKSDEKKELDKSESSDKAEKDEKEDKNVDSDESGGEIIMKSENKSESDEKKDSNNMVRALSKEIEKLNSDKKKEIEKLKSEFDKEIEKLKSDHMKEIEKLKSSDDSNVNSKETEHDKESTGTNEKDEIKKTENSENVNEKVIEKLMSDNHKEIVKFKSDHKKDLEDLEKQYKEEIDKIKSEHNKENKNSDMSKSGNNDKDTEKPETEEQIVNDETKESESNNMKDTGKKEKEEKKEMKSSGKDEKDIKSDVSTTEKDITSTTEAAKES